MGQGRQAGRTSVVAAVIGILAPVKLEVMHKIHLTHAFYYFIDVGCIFCLPEKTRSRKN